MILENIMRMMMIYQIYHDLSWSKMGILKLNRWFFWSDPLITTLQTSHSWHRLAILTTSCRCGELAWALNGSLVPQRRFWSLRWAQRSEARLPPHRHLAWSLASGHAISNPIWNQTLNVMYQEIISLSSPDYMKRGTHTSPADARVDTLISAGQTMWIFRSTSCTNHSGAESFRSCFIKHRPGAAPNMAFPKNVYPI